MLDLRTIITCLVMASIPTSIFLLILQFYTLGSISVYILTALFLNAITLNYFYRDIVVDIFKNIRSNYFK